VLITRFMASWKHGAGTRAGVGVGHGAGGTPSIRARVCTSNGDIAVKMVTLVMTVMTILAMLCTSEKRCI